MTTPRKKSARAAKAEPPPGITAEQLSEFIGIDADPDRLSKAIELASAAAAAELGVPQLPGNLSHPLAQAVKLLATQLLLLDQLDKTPTGDAIPLVVRYYLKVAAGAQG